MKRSLVDRYDAAALPDLEGHAAALAGTLAGPTAGPVHIAAVDVLDKLMRMSEATGTQPPQVRMLTTMMRQLRPVLLESFAGVDETVIVRLMIGLRDDIQTVIDQGAGTDQRAPRDTPDETVVPS